MKAIGIGLVLMLGGCAGLQSADPASPYYAYTTGWTVQLNRALTIPADAATVRLQYGRIVPRNSVQEHDPFCVVELDTVRAEPQTLQPGRFEVWRVTRSVNPITAAREIAPDQGSPWRRRWRSELSVFHHRIPSARSRPAEPARHALRLEPDGTRQPGADATSHAG